MADHALEPRSINIPGPSFEIKLSALDALHPVHYLRRLLIFRCESDNQRQAQLRSLENGLKQLIRQCPVLGGLVTIREGVQTIQHREAGLELLIRDLRHALPTYQVLEKNNFPPSMLPYDDLVPVALNIGESLSAPACMVQFTSIDGGSIVTWAMSHSVADGRGTDVLMALLSEHVRKARSEGGGGPDLTDLVGMDRSAIKDIMTDLPFDIARHPAYTSPHTRQSPVETIPNTSLPQTPLTTVVFTLSSDGLQRLKTACSPASNSDIAWISSHDAICALLWRTHVLTCGAATGRGGSSRIFFPSDARRYLGLNPEWIPNAVYQVTASVALSDMNETDQVSALRTAATSVRKALSSIGAEAVKSYFQHLETVGWVDWAFMGMSPVDFAMSTDWSSEVYADDWGTDFGPLRSWRYPGEPGGIRMGSVLPRRPDGSVEVMMTIGEDQVDLVHRMWEEWM